jgi:hypothetical protein
MSNYPAGRRPRSADPHSKLRLAALTAVVAGVLLLAAAAFVLSYSGIHQVALQAGVSTGLAKLYPVIFDAMLVIAGAAAMALRGAGWWSRFYAWACLILLLAAVATGDAVHATGTVLPARAARAGVAVTPWVLVLLAFGLLLTMLRHFRRARATVLQARQAAMTESGSDGDGTASRAVTWAAAGSAAGAPHEDRVSLVKLLEPRTSEPPSVEVPDDAEQHDPVSYGAETGYVHPGRWDEGEYSPHGDSGGPEVYAAPVAYPAHEVTGTNGNSGGPEVPAATVSYPGHEAAGTNGLSGTGAQAAPQDPADGAPAAADGTAAAGTAQSGPAAAAGHDAATAEQPAAEQPAAEEPGLERMRSTPTRPEE